MNPNMRVKLVKINRIANWVTAAMVIVFIGYQQRALRQSWENEKASDEMLMKLHLENSALRLALKGQQVASFPPR